MLRAIGYDDDFARVTGRTEPIVLRIEAVPGWQSVRLDPRAGTVTLGRGVELDLGSTGKALASDLAVEAASRALGPEVGLLVSLGGDIATAGPAPAGGWRILVAEDSATPIDAPGEVLVIVAGAVATSSTTVRRWLRGEVVLHHIVDPRTARPADGPWRTATVVADTCVDANIAATAAIILGVEAPGWLEASGLPARLVSIDGDVWRTGWPEPAAESTDAAASSDRKAPDPTLPPAVHQREVPPP